MVGTLPMTCDVCRFVERKRKEWGCEEPAEDPVKLQCSACLGNGEDYRGLCPKCGGKRWREIPVCPQKILREAGILSFTRAFRWSERGQLPNPGGWLDQPAQFVHAVDYVKIKIDELRELKDKRERKLEEARLKAREKDVTRGR